MKRTKRLNSDADRGMLIRQMSFIEELLDAMGAQGNSAFKKLNSVRQLLEPELVREIEYLNRVRNKISHKSGFVLTDDEVEAYRTRAKQAQERLIVKLDPDNQYKFRGSVTMLNTKRNSTLKKVAISFLPAGALLLGIFKLIK